MKYIFVLLAAGAALWGQPTPIPGDPLPTKPACTASRTTNCSVQADSSGNVSVSASVRVPDGIPLTLTAFTGVDPTGVADSTTGIQTAIDAAVAANKKLAWPPGTYKVTQTLTATGPVFWEAIGSPMDTLIDYRGTGAAIQIGTASTEITKYLEVKGIGVVLTQAAADAVGLLLYRPVYGFNLEALRIVSTAAQATSTQVGIRISGGNNGGWGGFGSVRHPMIYGTFLYGIDLTGSGLTAEGASGPAFAVTATQFYGGFVTGTRTGGNKSASIGLRLNNGETRVVYGTDFQGWGTGIQVENAFWDYLQPRFEGGTNTLNWATIAPCAYSVIVYPFQDPYSDPTLCMAILGRNPVFPGTTGIRTKHINAVDDNGLFINPKGSAVGVVVRDDTADTGVTTLHVKAGAGQGTAALQSWENASGTPLAYMDYTGSMAAKGLVSTDNTWGTAFSGYYLGSAKSVLWSSTANYYGAPDLSLSRSSAGVLEVNNGTAGAYRDLRLRTLLSATPGGPVPTWAKYSVVAIANGANGCANANGCWQVNGVLGANKTAGLTQDITLFQLPANGLVTQIVAKSATACAGATTIQLTDFGTTGNAGYFLTGQTYDLKTAVANGNVLRPVLTGIGADTAAATNITARITTTVENVEAITAGCAFDVRVLWAVAP